MAKYEGTYSCGHEGVVNIIGPQKDRQWKVERHFSGLCQECYRKEQQRKIEENKKIAMEKTAEMELPELTGTERQVAWANTIRINSIESFTKMIDNDERISLYCSDNHERIPHVTKEELTDLIDYIAKEYTSAKFWIESRTSFKNTAGDILLKLRKQKAGKLPEDVAADMEKEKENLTVTPIETKKNGIVILGCNPVGTIVTAEYVKDDDFRRIIKDKNFKWNPDKFIWTREVTEYTGAIDDRIAETGNALIAAGFTVQFPNSESKEKAISANYEIENDRWVKYNTESGQLAIVWKVRSDTLYGSAKKLPGAKWNNGSMKVSVEFYREVEDFAETMGFSISKKAREKIEEYKKKERGFEPASVSAKIQEHISDEERIEKSLKAGGTIIKDLMDT